MPEFKGFGDWIEIFKGGKQTDSHGREHDGNDLIDQAVASFDAGKHEPPIVIGHPADNGPAWGWVEALKKDTRDGVNYLLAKCKQVQPEFASMVEWGMFKKRSAAFYPDGKLRHVGFLGAMPPAVKGLADVAFSDGDPIEIEFPAGAGEKQIDTEKKEKRMKTFREFKEKLMALFEGIADETAIGTQATPEKTFSEADLTVAQKKAADDAAAAERAKVTAEFAEKDRLALVVARKEEIKTFCERMAKEGKMTPAMAKFGVPEMLAVFAERADLVEFGEGDTKIRMTLYDRFKEFFEKELPKVVTFKEAAPRKDAIDGQGDAAKKLNDLVRIKMAANANLAYGIAFAEVQRENPDLTKEYAQEIGR